MKNENAYVPDIFQNQKVESIQIEKYMSNSNGLDKEGVKYDQDKERYDLFPPEALNDIAKVFTYGTKKYADRNWEKGMKWGRIFGAIMRHSWAFWRGEDLDPESGLPHMAHAGWGCLVLLQYSRIRKEFDDRVKINEE